MNSERYSDAMFLERKILNGEVDIEAIPFEQRTSSRSPYVLALRHARVCYAEKTEKDFEQYEKERRRILNILHNDINKMPPSKMRVVLIEYSRSEAFCQLILNSLLQTKASLDIQ